VCRALLDGAADEPELRGDLLAGMDGEIGRMERLQDELSSLQRRDHAGKSPWAGKLLLFESTAPENAQTHAMWYVVY
jgi:hypothetical protein